MPRCIPSPREGVLELKRQHRLARREVEDIEIEIFDVAFPIVGGGEAGDKRTVRSKEDANHSLPYLIAVALLDDDVMPAQLVPDRIHRTDVQELLRKILVRPSAEFSRRSPEELPFRLSLRVRDGQFLSVEKREYEGFTTNPHELGDEFQALSEPHMTSSMQEQIAPPVGNLEAIEIRRLSDLLGQIKSARLDREEGVLQYGSR